MDHSEDLLSIGQVAEICHISIKTLRHYDKLRIIKPAFVDSTNKYRYYAKSQLPFIGYVREMRLNRRKTIRSSFCRILQHGYGRPRCGDGVSCAEAACRER